MQQPKSKFWILSGLPVLFDNIDVQSIRHQIPDINWANLAKIKEGTFILCFRFSVQISLMEVCERLSSIFSNEELNLVNYLHIAETVHTATDQKNIYVCHLPQFLHDEKKLRMLVNCFVKKVTVIDNCEYMTIRCQSCQNSSLAATFLRAIPAECLIDSTNSSSSSNLKSNKSNAKENLTDTGNNRIYFSRKLTVELSVSQLPIALIFKVNKDIKDYENDIPILSELRKEGNVSKDFIVAKSHINSPCMQVLAITASSLSEIDYIIDRFSECGFNAKRCLSVPQQEEIEKYEIIIENVQQKTISELRQRIKEEYNASIYEARIITEGDKRDALIIFYDLEDAMKIVQRLQNGTEHARLYRTTALLHNLPYDITEDEVKDFILNLPYKKVSNERLLAAEDIDVCIHQYNFSNKPRSQSNANENYECGAYAEIKLSSIEEMQRFVRYFALYENDEERVEKVPCIREVFIPFACETKRGRYKREVFYEKCVNTIVKENTIRISQCQLHDALSIISKGGFPILYFGKVENENEQQKPSTKKMINESIRMKAIMALSGASKGEVPSFSSNNNNRASISSTSSNDDDDNCPTEHNEESAMFLPDLLITFCSKEDMRKATDEFKSKEFNCEEFDASILQGSANAGNDEEKRMNDNNNSNNSEAKKLINPFTVERDDSMKFINEPAPQQQQQQQQPKMVLRPSPIASHSNQHTMRSVQRSQPSSKFNKKDSPRQNHLSVQKKDSFRLPPPKITKPHSNS
ncbi:hypothetical protein M9Y10_022128 [Tritrichomonas musculus]|uniref:RRM domain-containing protein n=1 Tax=Tritrichomonas musculus TaxID=1915356 RepID=A0ABR2KSB3_9EUKA